MINASAVLNIRTTIIRDFLIKGHTINEENYLIASNDIDQLKQDNEALREQVDKLNKDIEHWKDV